MTRGKKLAAIAALAVCAAVFLAGCTTFDNFKKAYIESEDNEETTVRIGVFEPLSGPDKDKAALEVMGIELAHELYPKALQKDVELIYADNQGDIYAAESAIQTLIKKRPAVVLGSYGSVNSLVAAKYLEEAQIPAIAITNTNPLVTSGHDYYFRVCFVDSYHGVAVAKYAVEELNEYNAAILRQRLDDEADAVCQVFQDKMIQLTGDPNAIVTVQEYTEGTEDFSEQLTAIKESGANVLFMPIGVHDAAAVMKQARQMRLGFTFLGTSAWETPELIEQAGADAAQNIAFATTFDADAGVTHMTEVFLAAYQRKYGQDAVPDPATAFGFDAYLVAINSINQIGTALDGNLLQLSISKQREFPGVSGKISFDSKGDPIKSVAIKSVENGEFVNVYIMEPSFT